MGNETEKSVSPTAFGSGHLTSASSVSSPTLSNVSSASFALRVQTIALAQLPALVLLLLVLVISGGGPPV
jgi:hypothetical protein